MNWMWYVRGNQGNYDYWARLGNHEWNSKAVWEYFKKSENNTCRKFVEHDQGKYHSDKGPLKVSFCGITPPYETIFKDAGAEQGYPFVKDINGKDHYGFCDLQGTIYGGTRQSSAKAFLCSVKDRPNLHVVTNAYVEKVLIDDRNRAIGVRYSQNGEIKRAYARKEVILSAGSIMTPMILMLSGVGPARQLLQHKIPVKAISPVGENLWDHIACVLFFQFNPTPTSPTAAFDGIYDFAIHSNGSFTAITQLTAFINLQKDKHAAPEIQLVFVYFSCASPDFAVFLQSMGYIPEICNHLILLNKLHDMAVEIVILLQPKSRGYVTMTRNCPYAKPFIKPHFFKEPEDMETLAKAMEQQVNFEHTHSYRKHGGKFVHLPLPECDRLAYKSIPYNKCYIKYMSATAYHQVGTCKMGPRHDCEAVVDSHLRVYKVRNLRVIDASM